MKLTSPLQVLAAFAALLATSHLAQAHPGHSAFDWTVRPHSGHAGEHAVFFIILALTVVGFVSFRLVSRKR